MLPAPSIDEPLARALCRARGFDPDERVPTDWLAPPAAEPPPLWAGFLPLARQLRDAAAVEGLLIAPAPSEADPPGGLFAAVDAGDEVADGSPGGWRVAFTDGRTSSRMSETMARRMTETSGGTLIPPATRGAPRRGKLLGILGIARGSS